MGTWAHWCTQGAGLLLVVMCAAIFLHPLSSDIQCFTVKPKLDLPPRFHRPVSEQIVR
jgi:hypothetical protein